MYTTPIILLVGQAGSGKDTVAGFMVKNHGAVSIAQADPMKRLGKILFDFTEEQLWGPSDCRNAPDPRFDDMWGWDLAWKKMESQAVKDWLEDLGLMAEDFEGVPSEEYEALKSWLNGVMTQTFWAKKQLTPRLVLQTLGTEWGRAQGRDLWSSYTIETAFELLGGGFRYDRTVGLIEDKNEVGPQRVVISDGRFRNEVINVRAVGGSVVRIDSPSADGSAAEAAGVKGHASEKEQKTLPRHFFTCFFYNDKALGLESCESNTAALVSMIDGNFFAVPGAPVP